MRSGTAVFIEEASSRLATGLFGLAIGYAGWAATGRSNAAGMIAIWAAVGGFTYIYVLKKLGDFGRRGAFSIPAFAASPVDLACPDELVLTGADKLQPADRGIADPLVLDDVLAKLEPDSRVVQLFDANRISTPADLDSRIRKHLTARERSAAAPDASDALHQALSELRTSLG